MNSFSLAWQFLTILPWRKSDQQINPQLLGRSMAFYPVIGLFLGMILWAAHFAFSIAFPRTLADGLIVMLLALLTGAFHLDGLGDTCDGLASGKTPEERLMIMKDHRVGTFGVVGLILILGMKFLALNSLPDNTVGRALLLALILSRWSMVQLTYRAPYARREGGLGLPFKENLRRREMIMATATSLALSFLFYRFWGMILWLVIGAFTLFFQKFFEKKIGGITGDTLGAANETNEVLVLLLASGMVNFSY
ncbi:MAG: adenosylcobinamide-GDP ribazoletransferase [Thermodesulfobacteriota bacterium]|nr:adenosylcobinamide-GDP ribazoletransferase [Thermodesulfobacteriota bacterium]